MDQINLGAKCACAAIAISAQAMPDSVIHCLCDLCRRLSGAAFSTWVSITKKAVSYSGGPAKYQASVHTLRHFCQHCGTHVFTTDSRHELLGIPAGLFAEEVLPPASGHYFFSHRAPWHSMADDLPCFGGKSGYEPL